jgi:hypothetical protein
MSCSQAQNAARTEAMPSIFSFMEHEEPSASDPLGSLCLGLAFRNVVAPF